MSSDQRMKNHIVSDLVFSTRLGMLSVIKSSIKAIYPLLELAIFPDREVCFKCALGSIIHK